MMKDADDWDYILNYTDALFYCLSNGIASRTGLSLEDAHEETWVLFEQGCFKLVGTDDSIGVVPCHSDDDRCAAMEQNQRLADYRRHVIEAAVAAA
jgi:hypothetical protein